MILDLAVVGGGPAGLATAIFAARRGLSVSVVESRRPPLDKACGEGIMPVGVSLLQEMGVDLNEGDCVPLLGVRYVDGAVSAEGRFPARPGWGVRRTTLVSRLIDRARDLGVEIRWGETARSWRIEQDGSVRMETDQSRIESKLLVGADGLHSRIRRWMGVEATPRGPRRFGVRRHFELTPWSSFVEVHWAEGAEAYVTPVGPREVGVAVLWGGEASRYETLLERFPPIRDRVAESRVTSRARGAGPFRQGVRHRCRGPVALVGDAAGYADALTGEGLSVAFQTAKALVDCIARDGGPAAYERAYRRLTRHYYWMTNLLLFVAERPRLRRRVVATLARDPALFDRFLAVSTGERAFHSVGLGGAVRMLIGSLRDRPESPSALFWW